MFIPVKPVPKPRMTRSDAWRQRPAVLRYFDYKDDMKEAWGSREVPGTFTVVFHVPIPKSFSKKKRSAMHGTPHQQRPDVDNYLKAFLDALCVDDSYVWDVRVTKLWSLEPGIEVLEL